MNPTMGRIFAAALLLPLAAAGAQTASWVARTDGVDRPALMLVEPGDNHPPVMAFCGPTPVLMIELPWQGDRTERLGGTIVPVTLSAGTTRLQATLRADNEGPTGPTVRIPAPPDSPLFDGIAADGALTIAADGAENRLAGTNGPAAVAAWRAACRR